MTLEQSPSYPGSGEEKFPPHRWFALGEEHSIFAESMDHPDVPDCVEYLSVAEHQALLREERARAFEEAAEEVHTALMPSNESYDREGLREVIGEVEQLLRLYASNMRATRAPVVQREEESR